MSVLPSYVRGILDQLNRAGYAAYVVGGAIRDLLRGVSPQDYDAATSARPEAVIAIASQAGWKVIDKLGHNFGVVLLLVEGFKVEVATLRGERYGADSHRPAEVWYAESIEEDLSRRDFTINAMAMGLDGQVIDPFGGRNDLDARVIRAVGDPHVRFAEDALRMLRACRFAAQLGFRIEEETFAAIRANLARVEGLSLERVRMELEKLLLGSSAQVGLDMLVRSGLAEASCRSRERGEYRTIPLLPELHHLVGMPQNPAFHVYDCWQHTLETVRRLPPDPVLRWAALLHDVAKGLPEVRGVGKTGKPTDYGHDRRGALIAEEILSRLQIPVPVRKRVVWLVARHMKYHFHAHEAPKALDGWLREEARSGQFRTNVDMCEAFGQLIELGGADAAASGFGNVTLPVKESFSVALRQAVTAMPVHTSDIAYDAQELLAILGRSQLMGPFLTNALRRIQDGNLTNDAHCVTEAARRWLIRQQASSKLVIDSNS